MQQLAFDISDGDGRSRGELGEGLDVDWSGHCHEQAAKNMGQNSKRAIWERIGCVVGEGDAGQERNDVGWKLKESRHA
jgi:hypothetical protein